MKHIYINISITRYSYHGMEPDCDFWQRVDDGEMEHRKLDYNTACRMMWELMLIGGERKITINHLNPGISEVEVSYWMCH